MALTTAQLARVARQAGEAHKTKRMVDDDTIQLIADDSGLVVDSADNGPLDTGYTTTYDLAAITAAVWHEKAARLGEGFDFTAEGASFTRSQAYRHAIDQAGRWAAKVGNLSA